MEEKNETLDESIFHGYYLLIDMKFEEIERIIPSLKNRNTANGRGVPDLEDWVWACREWNNCNLEWQYGRFAGNSF